MPGSAVPAQGRSDRPTTQVETLAVVVTVGTTPYLTQTLTAVARQSRAPEVLLLVDVASRANGLGSGEPVEDAVEASGLDERCAVRIVRAPEASTFGDAVRRGLSAYAALVATGNRRRRPHAPVPTGATSPVPAAGSGTWTGPTGALSPITTGEIRLVGTTQVPDVTAEHHTWLWLLHDDSAPEPGCLEALLDAIRAVYASAMSSEALSYRVSRGLADIDEQMAILVQRVSGDHHGTRFFPHAAGVANSSNLYTWDASVDADAGMLRLVFGLGTRAVDRTTSDHARIVALDDPLRSRLSDPEDLSAFSQRGVDVLDLAARAQVSVPLSTLVGTDIRADWALFTSPDRAALRRLAERGRAPAYTPVVADFRGLLAETPFPGLMRDALAALSEAYAYPVDVEFTVNATPTGAVRIGIVQCRPLQTHGPGAAVRMPEVVDGSGVLFASHGEFMGGNVRLPIRWVVAVRPDFYLQLGNQQRHGVARLVGELNRVLRDERFLLLGPGRWGTTTEALGVPVRFAEINHASALVEATDAQGNFRPELSYGSHFFQDLVETGVFYAAVFDDRAGVEFNPELVTSATNRVLELVPDAEPGLVEAVHVARFDDLELYSDVVSQRVLCARRSCLR